MTAPEGVSRGTAAAISDIGRHTLTCEHRRQLGAGQLDDRTQRHRTQGAGVVDEQVESVESLRGRHEHLAMGVVGDVPRHRGHAAASRLQLVGHRGRGRPAGVRR